jgi:hypothetical protein
MLARPLPKLVLSREEEIALKGLESPRTTAQAVALRALGAPPGASRTKCGLPPYLNGILPSAPPRCYFASPRVAVRRCDNAYRYGDPDDELSEIQSSVGCATKKRLCCD